MDLSSKILDISTANFARFTYENDLVFRTDADYSQGFSLELCLQGFHQTFKSWYGRSLFSAQAKTSLSFDHYVYTPTDIQTETIQKQDRPYSALFQIGIRKMEQKSRVWRLSKWSFMGMTGPVAFGEPMQTQIHRITGDVLPKGWGNQINNHFIAGYKLRLDGEVIGTRFLDGRFLAIVQLSNLKTFASAGFEWEIGTNERRDGTRWGSLYSQSWGHIIGWDATLQGFRWGVPSPHVIGSGQLNRFVFEQHVGLKIQSKQWQFTVDAGYKTQEFIFRCQHLWAGLKIGYAW